MKTRVYSVRLRFDSKIINVPEFKQKLGAVLRYWQSMTGDKIENLAIREVNHEHFSDEI